MKVLLHIILLFFVHTIGAQSFEIYNNDTINRKDANNKKQGVWYLFDGAKKQVVEKGTYLNNQKNGIWTTYFFNGNKKHEINFEQGSPIGDAKFYYSDGQIWEEGYWNIDHWEGNYKFYHKGGQLAYDWNYNERGRRTGSQKYYHENGKIKYVGNWDNGKTIGTLKVFNENGVLMAERVYDEGTFAHNVTHDVKTAEKKDPESSRTTLFKGTGNHTVYRIDKKVEATGFFVQGKLFNGTYFVYDEDGELIRKEVFKNGNLVRTENANNVL